MRETSAMKQVALLLPASLLVLFLCAMDVAAQSHLREQEQMRPERAHELRLQEAYVQEVQARFALQAGSALAAANEQDSLALVALYNATGGASWTNRTGWLTGPVSTWFGVTLSGDRVTSLILQSNNLQGSIPAELAQLSSLTWLSFYANGLSGSIPPELGNLSNLQTLSVGANSLSGSIPSALGNLSNLQWLYLYENSLGGAIPPELGQLSSLVGLALSDNNLSGAIPTELGQLAGLQRLWLNGNNLSGELPEEIGGLTSLLGIQVQNNSLTGSIPLGFTQLTGLQNFFFNNTQLCVPTEAAFQTWFGSVPNVQSTGVSCGSNNQAPVLANAIADQALTAGGATFTQNLMVTFADNDGDPMTFTATSSTASVASAAVSGNVVTVTPLAAGTTTVTVTANDGRGGTAQDAFLVTVTSGATTVRQTLGMQAGWNLVSLYVTPSTTSPGQLFASCELAYVTGFEGGAKFYDPNGLPFLNTLTTIRAGAGYWVKLNNSCTLQLDGPPLPANQTVDLARSWNLIGYWPEQSVAPAHAFAALNAAGTLDYVTGFEGGAKFYDPDGLPFLNSLQTMERGRGYWVKTSDAVVGFVYPPPSASKNGTADVDAALAQRGAAVEQLEAALGIAPGPQYLFLRAAVTLPHAPDRDAAVPHVEVVTADGRTVGVLPVWPEAKQADGSYVVQGVVYGDDPATDALEGAAAGAALHLRHAGAVLPSGVRFAPGGDVHEAGAVRFAASGEAALLDLPAQHVLDQNYPNPFNPQTAIRFALPVGGELSLEVFDVQGRRVAVPAQGYHEAGWHEVTFAAEGLPSGVYLYRLTVAGETVLARSMMLVK